MDRRAFVASLLGTQLRKSKAVLPSATASSASPVAGTVTFSKPAGALSWDITVKLARKTVFISTPNREWGLAFAQELLVAASAAPTRHEQEKETSDNAKPVV